MELKLKEILDYIHNYFVQDTFEGKIKIKNHELDNHEIKLLDDQYFMIKGSIYNDGIWQFKAIQEVDEENLERYLKDEEFNGIISKLAIPRDVLALKDEIIAWEDKNQDALNGVFQSESFGGYSYTLKSNSSNNKNGESISWKNKFGNRLKAYRKLG